MKILRRILSVVSAPLISIAFIIVVSFCGACSARKGYIGKERPNEEISQVFFGGEQGVSVSSAQVDEYEMGLFDVGIKVLAGEHRIRLFSDVPEELCWLGDDNECTMVSRRFFCEVNVVTQGGETYRVEARGYGVLASIWIIRESDRVLIASNSCKA